jgi:hypothetical protein
VRGLAFVGVFAVCLAVHQCARAATLTLAGGAGAWQMQKDCATPTVVRKGGDLVMRCDGVLWITIKDAARSCPTSRLTKDAAGNLTLHC